MKNLLSKTTNFPFFKKWHCIIKEIIFFAGLSLSTPLITMILASMKGESFSANVTREFMDGTFFLLTVSFIASALFSVAEVHNKEPIPGKSYFIFFSLLFVLFSESYVIYKRLGGTCENTILTVVMSVICLVGATILYCIAIANKIEGDPAVEMRMQEQEYTRDYIKYRQTR